MTAPILVGDIGGTNVRFGIASKREGRVQIDNFAAMAANAHQNFSAALTQYLAAQNACPARVCFAIAGPVKDNQVRMTNRNWHICARNLREAFGFSEVTLINDFTAMARAVPTLPAETFKPLIVGEAVADAPRLVAGPGTGFGVATLLRIGADGWQVLQGEGGHMAYAPQTELEFALARILIAQHGYISNELIASGSGMASLHKAFCELYDVPYSATKPSNIIALALAGNMMLTDLCKVRARAVLRACGDLVLANGARGGVILAGGVTRHLIPYFNAADVMPAFGTRGPLSHYLETCPVSLLTDLQAPLIGAAVWIDR